MENKNKYHLPQQKHYLKCKFYKYETYIGKIVGSHIYCFKTRMNNHITGSWSGLSKYEFLIYVFIALKEIIDN